MAHLSRASVMLVLATLLAPGCYSMSLLQEPANLGPGQARMGVGMSYYGGVPGFASGGVEGQLRVGITEYVELSAKHNGLGGGGGAKIRLLDERPYRLAALTGFQAALVADSPSAGGGRDAVVRAGYVTLLSAYSATSWLDLMIAPDVHAGVRSSNRDVGFVGFGGHVGLAFHPGDHVTLIPECSTMYIAAGPSPKGLQSFGEGDLRVQCGLGFSSGSAYPQTVK